MATLLAFVIILSPVALITLAVLKFRGKRIQKWLFVLFGLLTAFDLFLWYAATRPDEPETEEETAVEETVSQELEQETEKVVEEDPAPEEPVEPEKEDEPELELADTADLNVSFETIYSEYKENELRAEDKYQGNRYRITATVNGMETSGLKNLTGGATLTMEYHKNGVWCFMLAEFEKEQEDSLKAINVGDTITFDGTCYSWGSWGDCELVIGG